MAIARRSWRPFVITTILVFGVYIPLYFIYNSAYVASDHNTKDIEKSPTVNPLNQMQVDVKSIIPAADGTVDLVFRVNLQDLLSNVNSGAFYSGEATNNPIPGDPSFLHENADFCQRHQQMKYVIYVNTSPGNLNRRESIRKTWANPNLFLDKRTSVVFIMGKSEDTKVTEDVSKEIQQYGDIVVGNFVDEYRNLTTKGILALKWLTLHCSKAHYAIKADDDAFVNLFKLIAILDQHSDEKRLVTCPLWRENSMPILRDPNKCMKWCVRYDEFPGRNFFPKYCAGLAFVLTRDIVRDMYEAALKTPFFWIDDVYITGLLLEKTRDVKYVNLLSNFTLKENIALAQYTNFTGVATPTYYFTHIKTIKYMKLMWNATLTRISESQLIELSPEVYDERKDLVERVEKLRWMLKR